MVVPQPGMIQSETAAASGGGQYVSSLLDRGEISANRANSQLDLSISHLNAAKFKPPGCENQCPWGDTTRSIVDGFLASSNDGSLFPRAKPLKQYSHPHKMSEGIFTIHSD
jgi:hypothetical protein